SRRKIQQRNVSPGLPTGLERIHGASRPQFCSARISRAVHPRRYHLRRSPLARRRLRNARSNRGSCRLPSPFHRLVTRRLRRSRADTRVHRRLRGHLVFRQPAHPGNRHPHGARRFARSRPPTHSHRNNALGRYRHRIRFSRIASSNAPGNHTSVRRHVQRHPNSHRNRHRPVRGSARSGIPPRAPRLAHRANVRPSLKLDNSIVEGAAAEIVRSDARENSWRRGGDSNPRLSFPNTRFRRERRSRHRTLRRCGSAQEAVPAHVTVNVNSHGTFVASPAPRISVSSSENSQANRSEHYMSDTVSKPSVTGTSGRLKIAEVLRPHWKALTIAMAAVLGETLADIGSPWPIKIVMDNLSKE